MGGGVVKLTTTGSHSSSACPGTWGFLLESPGAAVEHSLKQGKYGQIRVQNAVLGPSQMSLGRGRVGGEHVGAAAEAALSGRLDLECSAPGRLWPC